jgi:hypothetical protein
MDISTVRAVSWTRTARALLDAAAGLSLLAAGVLAAAVGMGLGHVCIY